MRSEVGLGVVTSVASVVMVTAIVVDAIVVAVAVEDDGNTSEQV